MDFLDLLDFSDTLPSVLSSIVARRYAQHGTFEFRTAGPSKGFECASISIESPFSVISWFDRHFRNIGWSKNRASWTFRKFICAALALFRPSVSWVFETKLAELVANSRCRLMTILANFWWTLSGKRRVFSSLAQFIFCIRVWAILAGHDFSSLFSSQSWIKLVSTFDGVHWLSGAPSMSVMFSSWSFCGFFSRSNVLHAFRNLSINPFLIIWHESQKHWKKFRMRANHCSKNCQSNFVGNLVHSCR